MKPMNPHQELDTIRAALTTHVEEALATTSPAQVPDNDLRRMAEAAISAMGRFYLGARRA
jgi:hypothetical protein